MNLLELDGEGTAARPSRAAEGEAARVGLVLRRRSRGWEGLVE